MKRKKEKKYAEWTKEEKKKEKGGKWKFGGKFLREEKKICGGKLVL